MQDDVHERSPGASLRSDEALYELIAPDLDTWERAVRAAEPTLLDGDVLDRALRQALARFRQDSAEQTLTYLRWRVEQARAAAAATRAASVAARQAREQARVEARARGSAAPEGSPHSRDAERPIRLADARPRTFRDAGGCTWSVHEVAAGAVPWARGARCLLFGSETAIRRVWDYPADWRALSDAELEAVSWRA